MPGLLKKLNQCAPQQGVTPNGHLLFVEVSGFGFRASGQGLKVEGSGSGEWESTAPNPWERVLN